MAGRPKGLPKSGGGSRKGKPNKVNAALKDMILGALDGAGGVDYLKRQSKENPGPFMALVGKVLPLTLAGATENPLLVQIVGLRGELATKLDRMNGE